ncbi:MAG: hypothetical protein M0027_16495 [Candidatus Dormibacteraeota bacterium]|nr:hypothetical protein [Candidatus Dormibacteraeota bacterium]
MIRNPLQGRIGLHTSKTRPADPFTQEGQAMMLLSGAGIATIAVLLINVHVSGGSPGGPNGGEFAPVPVPTAQQTCPSCVTCAA